MDHIIKIDSSSTPKRKIKVCREVEIDAVLTRRYRTHRKKHNRRKRSFGVSSYVRANYTLARRKRSLTPSHPHPHPHRHKKKRTSSSSSHSHSHHSHHSHAAAHATKPGHKARPRPRPKKKRTSPMVAIMNLGNREAALARYRAKRMKRPYRSPRKKAPTNSHERKRREYKNYMVRKRRKVGKDYQLSFSAWLLKAKSPDDVKAPRAKAMSPHHKKYAAHLRRHRKKNPDYDISFDNWALRYKEKNNEQQEVCKRDWVSYYRKRIRGIYRQHDSGREKMGSSFNRSSSPVEVPECAFNKRDPELLALREQYAKAQAWIKEIEDQYESSDGFIKGSSESATRSSEVRRERAAAPKRKLHRKNHTTSADLSSLLIQENPHATPHKRRILSDSE